MTTTERKYPAPALNPEIKPFFDAATEGKLALKKCGACGQAHHYPRAICPFCASDRTEWITASGRGTIYSYSVMRRVPVPYAIGYVTLEEGVTMMTNIVDCDLDAIRIGQRVKVGESRRCRSSTTRSAPATRSGAAPIRVWPRRSSAPSTTATRS
jgi:uncharacterized OB-fold protein